MLDTLRDSPCMNIFNEASLLCGRFHLCDAGKQLKVSVVFIFWGMFSLKKKKKESHNMFYAAVSERSSQRLLEK